MEQGKVGLVMGHFSPAPTSPTLCNDRADSTDNAEKAPVQHTKQMIPKWTWPWRQKEKYSTPIVTRRLNDYPKGYPNVAAFLNSDEGFSIYRRFGYLQSRLLLSKQDDLRCSEQKLQEMEAAMIGENKDRLCYRKIVGTDVNAHRELLEDIERKFCSYSNVLTAAQQLTSLGKPSEAERESVGRYIKNRRCLIDGEATWIYDRDDLVTLRAGREHAWLDSIVEYILHMCHCRLIAAIFCSKYTRKKTEDDKSGTMLGQPPPNEDKFERYYTPSRVAKLTNGILTLVILLLLVVPIYILYHMVHDIGSKKAYMTCIGVLLVFTLAFSSVLSLFTKARRHEILAAAAAYCAVLVVFLGNVGPGTLLN